MLNYCYLFTSFNKTSNFIKTKLRNLQDKNQKLEVEIRIVNLEKEDLCQQLRTNFNFNLILFTIKILFTYSLIVFFLFSINISKL
jgi:hypothetical protein